MGAEICNNNVTESILQDEGGNQRGGSKDKERFTVRESLLTIALREDGNHEASFALVKVIIGFIITATLLLYAFDHSILMQDASFLLYQFRYVHVSLAIDAMYLLLGCLLVYSIGNKKKEAGFSGIAHVLAIILVMAAVIVIPMYVTSLFHLSLVVTTAIMQQQTRAIMKMISFLAEKGEHADNAPTIKSFVYFMFAPTLIYQYSYPRSGKERSWMLVAHHFLEAAFLFVPMTLTIRFMTPVWQSFGRDPITASTMYQLFLGSMALALMQVTLIGYFFIHVWSNMWAEALGFGDRHFYRNHWSAKSGVEWFSAWNLIVKNWIVRYLYVPAIRVTGNALLSSIYVLIISAVMHDYVYSMSLGFFFPLSTVFFMILHIPAMLLNPTSSQDSTIAGRLRQYIFFMTLVAMVSAVEYWSRINCPAEDVSGSVVDLFKFRSFTCLSFQSS